jgi:hypothetical protein
MTPGQSSAIAGGIDATATLVRFDPTFQAALCAQLALPSSVVLTLFNASHNEAVLAIGCVTQGGIQYVQIQRAWSGSSARVWPIDTCVCVGAIILGVVCPDPAKQACCPPPLDGVHAAGCLEIDRTHPEAPVIRLPASGVVAGDYCGLTVNACGLVTHIDANWPAACLPAFNPCSNCGSGATHGGGGLPTTGTPTAGAIPYSPRVGAVYALGSNLQDSLDQLDAGLAHCCGSTVATISAGLGLSLSGSPTNPTISHSTSALPAGNYGGFATDAYGHLTSYTPPPLVLPQQHVSSSSALSISYNSGSDSYTYSLAYASQSSPGIVQLATASAVTTGILGPEAITLDTIQAAVNKWAPAVTPFSVCALTAAPVMGEFDGIAICNGAVDKKITKADLSREIGVFAAGRYDNSTSAIAASRNITSIAVVSPGRYRVLVDTSAFTMPVHFAVVVTFNDQVAIRWASYKLVTANSFDVFIYDATDVLVANSFDFHCVALY